jgi:hypothetical protein
MSALLPPAARRPLPASGVGGWLREGVARRHGCRRNWARMSPQQQQPPETHNQPTDWCRRCDRSIKGSDTPQPADDGVTLFNPGAVRTTRYRYRGAAIPSPWQSAT